MKKIVIILFVSMFSFVCFSQTNTSIKSESPKLIVKPINFNSFEVPRNYTIPALNYSFMQQNSTKRFSFYYFQTSPRLVMYDNYKHQYYFNDPLCPYSEISSALIGGTLNYLFLLFDKKK
jgi:hypothetical protein